jgi:uncharacterized membrane protein
LSNVAAGAVLAAVSSLLYNAGFLVEKRALDRLPPVQAHRLGHLVRSLLSSRVWIVGFVVVVAGLLLQVLALSLAPLSVVQPVLVAGIIVLVVCSHVALGERLGRAERIAVGLVILGLGAVVVSLMRGGNGTGHAASQPVLLLVAVPVALVAAAVGVVTGRSQPPGARRRRWRRVVGPQVAGVAAGLLYGVAALGLKSMSFNVRGHGLEYSIPHMLPTVGPWMLGIATLAGLVVFQAALQRHQASLVVPLSNVTSSAFAVIAGAAIFHETLPSGTWPGVVRYVGFGLLLMGIVFAGAAPGEVAPASDVDVMGALPVTEPLAEAGQWPS